MAERRKKRSFFLPGLMAYVLIWLVALLVGLRYFWMFLADYEASRPKYTVQAFEETFDFSSQRAYAESWLQTLNPYVNTTDGYFDMLVAEVSNDVSCLKHAELCTDSKQVYAILHDGKPMGEMTMQITGQSRFGFDVWQVTDVDYDFSDLTKSYSVTIPEGWSLYCNGNLVGPETITARGIPIPLLRDFDAAEYELPTQVTYTVDNFIGELRTEIRNPSGVVVTELNEQTMTDNCTDGEKASLDSFLGNYIERLVNYSSNYRGNRWGNYESLAQLIVDGSELEQRMHEAMDGLNYVPARYNPVTAITVHNYMNLGNGRYFLKLTYNVDVLGQTTDVNATENHLELIVTEHGDGYLALTQQFYT